jgi:DDE superfamily endonuclease
MTPSDSARRAFCGATKTRKKLAERDELVVCLDEKSNLQALARRRPTQLLGAGRIERQEHEYVRHGTVTFFAALAVPTGQMWGRCLHLNDSAHLRPALHALFRAYAKRWRRIHVIWDGGSSHISAETADFLRSYRPHVRVLLTPAHASWLNQAELLLRAFSARYLSRGDWSGRTHLVEHLEASWREYNRPYAHPFTWSWTRRDLRKWLQRQGH